MYPPLGLTIIVPCLVESKTVKPNGPPSGSVSFVPKFPVACPSSSIVLLSSNAIGGSFTGFTVITKIAVSHFDGEPLSHTT